MATTDETTRRKDAERNREAILDAARQLFARSADVPMYEVARAAGIGQGTLYRHFPDRSALALAIFDEEIDQLERLAIEHADDPEAFFVLIRAVVEIQVRLQGLVTAMHEEEPDVEPDEQALKDRLFAIIAKPFRKAKAAESLRPDIVIEDVLLMMAMMDGALRRRPEDADPEATGARALTIALEGIRGRASE